MKASGDERKLSLYFPFETINEISEVSQKLNRPKSWVVRQAWEIAKKIMSGQKKTYSERWKEDFVMVVNDVSERTKNISEKDIEKFAAAQARLARRGKASF